MEVQTGDGAQADRGRAAPRVHAFATGHEAEALACHARRGAGV